MRKKIGLNRICEVATLCMLLLFSSFGIAHAGVIYKMYATHPFDTEGGKSSVSVYDFGAKRLISTLHTVPGATLARVTPDGKEVWFFSSADKSAGVFSVATDEPVGKAYLDAPVCDAVFDPDSAICYVACGSNKGDGGLNVVKFIDTDRRVAAYTIGVGVSVHTISCSQRITGTFLLRTVVWMQEQKVDRASRSWTPNPAK